MGSCAQTCCVSGLPIRNGDKVRYLLLTEHPKLQLWENGYQCTLSIDSLHYVRTFPISGRYQDESKQLEKVVKDLSYHTWLDGFALDVIERPQGENEYHDVPVTRKMTFKELESALWEERIFVGQSVGSAFTIDPQFKGKVPDNLPRAYRVGRAMIREDVWQGLLKLPVDYENLERRGKPLQSYVDFIQKAWKDLVNPEPEPKYGEDPEAKKAFGEYWRKKDQERERALWTHVHTHSYPPSRTAKDTFELAAERAKKGLATEEEVETFLKVCAETLYIESILEHVRYQWRPSELNGPQQTLPDKLHRSVHLLYAGLLNNDMKREHFECGAEEAFDHAGIPAKYSKILVEVSPEAKPSEVEKIEKDLREIPFTSIGFSSEEGKMFFSVKVDTAVAKLALSWAKHISGVTSANFAPKKSNN